MPAHAHEDDQYSVLLLGGFTETAASGEYELAGVQAGFKPAGLRHQNRFGADGALIFAVDRPASADAPGAWRWRCGRGAPRTAMLARALLRGGAGACDTPDLLEDLTASFPSPGEPCDGPRAPAQWLARVRDAINDNPQTASLKTLARDAGVHHVHLSRAFARTYGQPLSLYRRRVMAMRAAAVLAEGGSPPAHAACAAGFADQAHLTRVMRAELGITPSRLRRLFAAAG